MFNGAHGVTVNSTSPTTAASPGRGRGTDPLGRSIATTGTTVEMSSPVIVGRVPAHHRVPASTLVALLDEHLEALALEPHGVDAEVHQDADAVRAEHHERVRVDLDDLAGDGRDHRGLRRVRVRSRRRARPSPRRRPGRGTLGRAGPRARDRARAPRSRSHQVLDVLGEVVGLRADDHLDDRCRTPPRRARRRPSERLLDDLTASSTSVRSRVMHASISTMLAAPPRPARICSALLLMGPLSWVWWAQCVQVVGAGDLGQATRGCRGRARGSRASSSTISCAGTIVASGASRSGRSGARDVHRAGRREARVPADARRCVAPRSARSRGELGHRGDQRAVLGGDQHGADPGVTTEIGPWRRSA